MCVCVREHACLCGCVYSVFVCWFSVHVYSCLHHISLVPFLIFEWEFLHEKLKPRSPEKTSPKRVVLPGLIS